MYLIKQKIKINAKQKRKQQHQQWEREREIELTCSAKPLTKEENNGRKNTEENET